MVMQSTKDFRGGDGFQEKEPKDEILGPLKAA